MFAVIQTGGKQYKVAKNDVVVVEKLGGEPGGSVEIDSVLMVGDDGKTTLGTPFIEGALVTAEVVEQTRGPKVTIFKKKRRKNHRKTLGHRQDLTVLKITDIAASGKKKAAPAKKAAAPKKAEGEDKDVKSEAKTETKKAPAKKESGGGSKKASGSGTKKAAPAKKASGGTAKKTAGSSAKKTSGAGTKKASGATAKKASGAGAKASAGKTQKKTSTAKKGGASKKDD